MSTLSGPFPFPHIFSFCSKWLTDWRLRLVKEKARLVGTCEELRAYLSTMWRRLDKPADEQKEFLEKHGGFKPEDLEALQVSYFSCFFVWCSEDDIGISDFFFVSWAIKTDPFFPRAVDHLKPRKHLLRGGPTKRMKKPINQNKAVTSGWTFYPLICCQVFQMIRITFLRWWNN